MCSRAEYLWWTTPLRFHRRCKSALALKYHIIQPKCNLGRWRRLGKGPSLGNSCSFIPYPIGNVANSMMICVLALQHRNIPRQHEHAKNQPRASRVTSWGDHVTQCRLRTVEPTGTKHAGRVETVGICLFRRSSTVPFVLPPLYIPPSPKNNSDPVSSHMEPSRASKWVSR